MDKEKKYIIGEKLAQGVGVYLLSRPMNEVEILVNGLRGMCELVSEKKEDEIVEDDKGIKKGELSKK